jgi:hypothetical protein
MTACTPLPLIRPYSPAADVPVETFSDETMEREWTTESTDTPISAATSTDALVPTAITEYGDSSRPWHRSAAFRPRYTGLDEEDLIVDSPRAWESRIADFQARGFVRNNDPRHRP